MRGRLRPRTVDVAGLALELARGEGARARVQVAGLPLGWLAETLPGVPALGLVAGELSLEAQASLSEAGALGPVSGRAVLRDARLADRPELALDRAVLGLGWTPGGDRIVLREVSAGSDALALRGRGQVLLEEGLTGPVQIQLRLGETVLDPEGLLDRPVRFDRGLIEARVTQRPLALRIGQAMVDGPSGTARAAGRVGFVPGGLDGALRLSVPAMEVGDLAALWPRALAPGARRWFTDNLRAGRARDATALLRLRPGRPPRVEASFAFEDGRVRFMRTMPEAEAARGAAQFDGTRFVLRIDAARIPAVGPDAAVEPGMPRLDLRDTTLVIPDARARPARAEMLLNASGAVEDVMALLDNEPLRLPRRIGQPRDFVRGEGSVRVALALPLREGNAPADIDWSVAAELRDVRADDLVPGRPIAAERLTLAADPEGVEIAGTARFDGVPFEGSWRQPLPPPATGRGDPDAPSPAEPRPTASVSGVARVAPGDLERLGVSVGALALAGRASAQIDVTLPAGAPPRIAVASTLEGMRVGLPAIGWSKPAGRRAEFALEATLGATPQVDRVAVDAPGLAAEGSVRLAAGGGLERARFDRVDAGWFVGPVTLIGRGPGAAPRVEIGGGRADLRRATFGGGGGGGADAPVSVRLARLTVTDGIALTDLVAELQGGQGRFEGRINGGTPVAGIVVPQRGGTAVQLEGGDAGGVLRSAGLFQDARGGRIQLTLRPTGAEGVYDGALRIAGLRVRNAPALASLLQALSVVGLLEQLDGDGLSFETVESDFTLRPGTIAVRRASAVGPSMSITADGLFDTNAKVIDMQGVISPIYLVNGLFGALFGQRDEGLFGFTYRLRGPVAAPQVEVDPLSILTPGAFREIFRRAPPDG
jgi:hypothetical protein